MIEKIAKLHHRRQLKKAERMYDNIEEHIEREDELKQKWTYRYGIFTVPDNLEEHREKYAEKIAKHREKLQEIESGDYTFYFPQPSHVTQTNWNFAKIFGFAIGGVAVGAGIEYVGMNYVPGLAGEAVSRIGSVVGFGAVLGSVIWYAPKVANQGVCDLCGDDVVNDREVYLKNEDRGRILQYNICGECYEEKESEHIPRSEMRWSWQKFQLVAPDSDATNKTEGDYSE